MAHSLVLMWDEITSLWKVNKTISKCKSCKRKYIQSRGTLKISAGAELAAPKGASKQEGSEKPVKRGHVGGGVKQE